MKKTSQGESNQRTEDYARYGMMPRVFSGCVAVSKSKRDGLAPGKFLLSGSIQIHNKMDWLPGKFAVENWLPENSC